MLKSMRLASIRDEICRYSRRQSSQADKESRNAFFIARINFFRFLRECFRIAPNIITSRSSYAVAQVRISISPVCEIVERRRA